jgi:hypothetical protein
MDWHIEGKYFENCNCDILCPCLTSNMQGPADNERCQVPMICHITSGAFGKVQLDGLNFVMMIDAPAIMSQGNWRSALYIDERADAEQRKAIEAILSGDHGGMPAMIAGLTGSRVPVKYVPITFRVEGLRWYCKVPGVMEWEIEGITSHHSDKAMEVINVGHPMGNTLPIARSLKGVYSDADFGLTIDNTGKNGHYREFSWQNKAAGPT